jgi:hypothetical protein
VVQEVMRQIEVRRAALDYLTLNRQRSDNEGVKYSA